MFNYDSESKWPSTKLQRLAMEIDFFVFTYPRRAYDEAFACPRDCVSNSKGTPRTSWQKGVFSRGHRNTRVLFWVGRRKQGKSKIAYFHEGKLPQYVVYFIAEPYTVILAFRAVGSKKKYIVCWRNFIKIRLPGAVSYTHLTLPTNREV